MSLILTQAMYQDPALSNQSKLKQTNNNNKYHHRQKSVRILSLVYNVSLIFSVPVFLLFKREIQSMPRGLPVICGPTYPWQCV